MKVQLIRPPMDDWYQTKEEQLGENTSIPIGLLILAKSLRGMKNAEVEVLDGLHKPIDYIIDKIDADFVGATSWYSNYLNTIKVLEHAKKTGAKTIIGGPNVNHIAKNILANREYIDLAVVGDGEEALPMILSGAPPDRIPNIAHRTTNGIKQNFRRNAKMTALFDLEDVIDSEYDTKNSVPLSSIRGCMKAELDKRCSFCSIDHKIAVMRPELVWEQIRLLHNKYGFDYFWESGDDFFVGNFPQKLLETRPKDLANTELKVYACVKDITEENSGLLEALNVREVMIGFDSADDYVLKVAGKQYDESTTGNAIYLLTKRKINLHMALIYGLNNETVESAGKNYRLAQRIFYWWPKAKIAVSHAIPFAGTELFEAIADLPGIEKEYHGNLRKDDFFDYKALAEIQLRHFTSLTYEQAEYYVRKTKAIGFELGKKTSFGINDFFGINEVKNETYQKD